ncbi:protein translocase subunit SecF [Hyphomicrobium sp.]|uniref:protein translocase subunit SecF n=1 Tax=Hyphomicrobium sp. TaxID=82 RepID=UPI0025C4A129|nr:protein translocase subunit SecF [Hyphomicrobium sp.]MCC7251572.1 protein translocase subunit SecF [Hyphomicrobium sp.]
MFLVPDFKGNDFFPHGTRLPFMRYKLHCLVISTLLTLLSLGIILTKGFNYGVDFKGGSMIEVRAKSGAADVSAMRGTLSGLGLGDVQIQSFGTEADVLIRIEQQPGEEEAQQAAADKVLAALGNDFELRRIEVVGPAVSSELRFNGLIAILAAMVAIVAYVWVRFEWQFSVGVLVGLVHDVVITAGIFSLFWLEFDLAIVSALLTILGYSINDSVVVADRIRENLRKYKKMPLTELLDLSINETLSRTVLTGVTTIAVLLSLFFLGGEVIRNFTFCMLFGVLVGTYSSIFVSAPLIDYLGIKRDWSGETAKTGAGAGVSARP